MKQSKLNGWVVALAIGVSSAFVLGGCSSAPPASTDETNGPGSAADFGIPEPRTSAPSKILMDVPLSAKPPTGKVVGIVGLSTPSSTNLQMQNDEAAKALGWTTQVFPYSTDPGGSIQQALNAGVDYLILHGVTKEAVEPQLKAAHEAGVPVVNGGTTGRSDPSQDYYIHDSDLTASAELGVDWMIMDSNGTANAVYVSILAIPVFITADETMATRFSEKCPKCTYDSIDITFDQLAGGQIPSVVAAYLQSHPDVNYLFMQWGDLMPGLIPVLESAGLADGVTIAGGAASKAEMLDTVNDNVRGWIAYPGDATGWQSVDILARLSVGDDVSELIDTPGFLGTPAETWVMATPESAEPFVDLPYGWPGPDGFQEQYKALWQVD